MESTAGGLRFHQTVAKRMLDYLNKSEVLRVGLEYHVLAPNELNIDIGHIVRQVRGDGQQRLFRFSAGKEQMRHWSPVWRGGRNSKGCSSYWNRRARSSARRLSSQVRDR